MNSWFWQTLRKNFIFVFVLGLLVYLINFGMARFGYPNDPRLTALTVIKGIILITFFGVLIDWLRRKQTIR